MEFHDILHGHIEVDDREMATFLGDLLESPEVHRLRNMRQMNFDVPLIQELGRSRRLPHSIGVAHLAYQLTAGKTLHRSTIKSLVAAALLHDAAIPPFGHLVESELKAKDPAFSHEHRLKNLMFGLDGRSNKYGHVVHGKSARLIEILDRHGVDPLEVLRAVCPEPGKGNFISAGVDIDNIDNVHRMACMLGWKGAAENLSDLVSVCKVGDDLALEFGSEWQTYLARWADFRNRIYTMIISHPQCIPHNALQADLCRAAVREGIITSDDWRMTEPEFEEALRHHPRTKQLAWQLISGCEYILEDYVWVRELSAPLKMSNSEIAEMLIDRGVVESSNHTLFIWNENGLISRQIDVRLSGGDNVRFGWGSRSCMIALVRTKRTGRNMTKRDRESWRRAAVGAFAEILGNDDFVTSFPEGYSGRYLSQELGLGLGHH
ncbi:hypothetical protein [Stenotrophomonas lactitubi]|uniref:hypothetical protein n=1 Tax=Stenotrophomonas lactitubi TaxID=2045214 RepID=UPI0032088F3F